MRGIALRIGDLRIGLLLLASTAFAAPRIDNVLEKMTPPDATSLVGARMDALRTTELFRRLVDGGKLPQFDRFAQETGFDPRTDVREVLFVTTPKGSVLLSRGNFRLNAAALRDVPRKRHGAYEIRGDEKHGFCILDSSLAAAGDVPAIEEALDEWVSGRHTGAKMLLAKVSGVGEKSQIWGVSTGLGSFLADNIPQTAGGLDFSRVFKGLQDVWFEGDTSVGFKASVHGLAARDEDAVNLRDTVRGLVGMGRLSVPEKQPELLRLWDGITAEQTGRTFTIRVDVSHDLIEKLVDLFSAPRPGARMDRSRI